MRRRTVLLAGMGLGVAAVAGTGSMAVFRWHQSPRRDPFLTQAHLQELTRYKDLPGLRALFVGNSFTLMHDIPARVQRAAAQDGITLQTAMAAANGARLVEILRIPTFQDVLEQGWDILVLQDFSTTSLRHPDRMGSAWAMRQMVRRARPRAVMIYPTWAFPPQHRVYSGEGRLFARTPKDPNDFADMITKHYAGIARREGWIRAPVTEAFLPDARAYLQKDLHHLNAAGASRVAGLLWDSLRIKLAGIA